MDARYGDPSGTDALATTSSRPSYCAARDSAPNPASVLLDMLGMLAATTVAIRWTVRWHNRQLDATSLVQLDAVTKFVYADIVVA